MQSRVHAHEAAARAYAALGDRRRAARHRAREEGAGAGFGADRDPAEGRTGAYLEATTSTLPRATSSGACLLTRKAGRRTGICWASAVRCKRAGSVPSMRVLSRPSPETLQDKRSSYEGRLSDCKGCVRGERAVGTRGQRRKSARRPGGQAEGQSRMLCSAEATARHTHT
jgi:hypothetical protein